MRIDRVVSSVSLLRPNPPLAHLYSTTATLALSLTTSCVQSWPECSTRASSAAWATPWGTALAALGSQVSSHRPGRAAPSAAGGPAAASMSKAPAPPAPVPAIFQTDSMALHYHVNR